MVNLGGSLTLKSADARDFHSLRRIRSIENGVVSDVAAEQTAQTATR
jgi:hypothetical protein